MGRGLVEPVDDFRVTNPPSNEALAAGAGGRFHQERFQPEATGTANSELTCVPALFGTERNEHDDDQVNYSQFLVRRLMSEQIVDSMAQITGVPEKFSSMPLGNRAMTIPVLPFTEPNYMMKVFGRNELREVICERDTKPSVAQVMHLVSGDTHPASDHVARRQLDAWLGDPR